MDGLWEQLLSWGQASSLHTIILVVLGVLVVSALLSFAFRLVKVGIVVVLLLLLVGVSPMAITSWVGKHMDAKNFGVAKLENASASFIPLPTTWKATLPDGTAYICYPDITPEGLGGLVCDEHFYPSSDVKDTKEVEGKTNLVLTTGATVKDCEEVKAGFGCAMTPEVKLSYKAPK